MSIHNIGFYEEICIIISFFITKHNYLLLLPNKYESQREKTGFRGFKHHENNSV